MYCYAKEVPTSANNVFDNSYIEYATLHVPASSIDSYRIIEPWKNFKDIVKINMPEYTLTYIVNGEEYKKYIIEEGAIIIPESAPTKEGYTFSGWSDIPETMPAHDVVVHASYTTGIREIILAKPQEVQIYSPNGKKLNKLQKGLNIVVMSNGKTQKVVGK